MTKHADFKGRVRARMAKTGESYATARTQLLSERSDVQTAGRAEEWMTAAQGYTTVDLQPFFEAWVFSPTAPARTAANGFR